MDSPRPLKPSPLPSPLKGEGILCMWLPLSNLIPSALKKSGISQQVSDAMVCEEFDKIAAAILGAEAQRAHAVYLKNRELWVAVLSSAVSNELKMYEQDILKALEDKFGAGKIAALRFLT